MRILFFSRLFYPHLGGVEKHVLQISQELIKKGHRVTVVTERYDDLPVEETYKGISIYRIPLDQDKDKKLQIWMWFFRHLSLLLKADIIHCHDVFFWYLPFRILLPWKKVFMTFHGYETVFPPEKSAIRMRRIAEKLSLGNICIGKFIETWYGTKADVISYGAISQIKNSEFKIHNSKLRCVFIGRLEKDTGILFYESLIGALKKQKIPVTLDVYGEGSLKDSLKVGTYKGVTKDVDKTLEAYDVCFTSSYLSILDALNHELLVISTYDNPLKKDYLMDTPFRKYILIGTDPKELAGKMKSRIEGREKLTSLLTSGKEWVRTQTWEYLTDQYLKLWQK